MKQSDEIPVDKIQSFIEMAFKEQLTWVTLASIMDDLTPTFAISKQVIKILLTELEALQTKLKTIQVKS